LSPDKNSFKEYSVALGPYKQAVYFERWQRYPDGKGPYLALRRVLTSTTPNEVETFLIIVGNHFGYARDRQHPLPEFESKAGGCGNLVDSAFERGERDKMEHLLELEGTYGHIRNPKGEISWNIHKSTHPWREGKPFMEAGSAIFPSENGKVPESIFLFGEKFEVFECNFSALELRELFMIAPGPVSKL